MLLKVHRRPRSIRTYGEHDAPFPQMTAEGSNQGRRILEVLHNTERHQNVEAPPNLPLQLSKIAAREINLPAIEPRPLLLIG